MGNLHFHHVAQKGVPDLCKTVFSSLDMSILDAVGDTARRRRLQASLEREFPTGVFNCWGVPEGAERALSKVVPGDYVLLVEGVRFDSAVPALCHVRLVSREKHHDLSTLLWQDDRYPWVFFFTTERLDLTWKDFLDHIGYSDGFNPRGRFYSVNAERLAKFGGPDAYAAYLRKRHSLPPAGG